MRVGYPIVTLLVTIVLASLVGFAGVTLPPAPTVAWSAISSGIVPILIFLLRTSDLTISTIRTLTIVQGRRTTAWLLAFLQSSLFVVGVAGVLEDLDNPWNLAAYALGFAFGNVLGMAIDSKTAHVRSPQGTLARQAPNPGNRSERFHHHGAGSAVAGRLENLK
ncbi:MAG: DUF5698 domain-containing protein [Anaerolineales bacterium]